MYLYTFAKNIIYVILDKQTFYRMNMLNSFQKKFKNKEHLKKKLQHISIALKYIHTSQEKLKIKILASYNSRTGKNI